MRARGKRPHISQKRCGPPSGQSRRQRFLDKQWKHRPGSGSSRTRLIPIHGHSRLASCFKGATRTLLSVRPSQSSCRSQMPPHWSACLTRQSRIAAKGLVCGSLIRTHLPFHSAWSRLVASVRKTHMSKPEFSQANESSRSVLICSPRDSTSESRTERRLSGEQLRFPSPENRKGERLKKGIQPVRSRGARAFCHVVFSSCDHHRWSFCVLQAGPRRRPKLHGQGVHGDGGMAGRNRAGDARPGGGA